MQEGNGHSSSSLANFNQHHIANLLSRDGKMPICAHTLQVSPRIAPVRMQTILNEGRPFENRRIVNGASPHEGFFNVFLKDAYTNSDIIVT